MAALLACDSVWRPCPLYLGNLEELWKEDVIDVLRLTMRPKSFPRKPGMTDASKVARDALAEDPYNLCLINELGRIYASEAQWDRCANVLLRGWKRAHEIEDVGVRFRFLMKLCEVSYYLGRHRQAHAVLRDIAEPEDPRELGPFLALSCQVYAANGDLQRALRAFQRAVEPRSFQDAARFFALTLRDLKRAGAFEAARSAVEKKATAYDNLSVLSMLESFAEACDKPPSRGEELQKYFLAAGVVAVVAVLLYCLYLLEQWSLRGLKGGKAA